MASPVHILLCSILLKAGGVTQSWSTAGTSVIPTLDVVLRAVYAHQRKAALSSRDLMHIRASTYPVSAKTCSVQVSTIFAVYCLGSAVTIGCQGKAISNCSRSYGSVLLLCGLPWWSGCVDCVQLSGQGTSRCAATAVPLLAWSY